MHTKRIKMSIHAIIKSKRQSHAIQNKDIKLKESLIKIPISCAQ